MLLRIRWPEHESLDPLWYKVDLEFHDGSNGVEAAWRYLTCRFPADRSCRRAILSGFDSEIEKQESEMRIALQDLFSIHPALRGHPIEFTKSGGFALQRAGHVSPTDAEIEHDGALKTAEIEWTMEDIALMNVLDKHRVTEDGAEAVALAYVNSVAGWKVKRRLQRGEGADWLLRNESGWLALEVSGTIVGNPRARLEEKKKQVSRCSLAVDRLAVVVAFDKPAVLAVRP
jgi:hypothetical protein